LFTLSESLDRTRGRGLEVDLSIAPYDFSVLSSSSLA